MNRKIIIAELKKSLFLDAGLNFSKFGEVVIKMSTRDYIASTLHIPFNIAKFLAYAVVKSDFKHILSRSNASDIRYLPALQASSGRAIKQLSRVKNIGSVS